MNGLLIIIIAIITILVTWYITSKQTKRLLKEKEKQDFHMSIDNYNKITLPEINISVHDAINNRPELNKEFENLDPANKERFLGTVTGLTQSASGSFIDGTSGHPAFEGIDYPKEPTVPSSGSIFDEWKKVQEKMSSLSKCPSCGSDLVFIGTEYPPYCPKCNPGGPKLE